MSESQVKIKFSTGKEIELTTEELNEFVGLNFVGSNPYVLKINNEDVLVMPKDDSNEVRW